MTIAFNAIQNTILIFPDERPVFLREVNNNMYSVSGYFFAKILADLPVAILTPVIFGCIVYFAIGYSTVYTYSFPIFRKFLSLSYHIAIVGILILIYCAGGSYALIISSIFSDK